MNIFHLHKNPTIAAQMMCDKHVVKMIVESAQMLSTAHHILDENVVVENIYKSTHVNHPSNKWVRETSSNYDWLYEHFCALCDEYTHRYGKVHLTDKKLREGLSVRPNNILVGPLTKIPLAMKQNPECQFPDDPVKSYRMYYKTKTFDMKWTKRKTPKWMKEECHAV